MTTGGKGIPRLQELSYLEVAAQAVAGGSSFEEIRRELVEHMLRISQASPGTGNTAAYRNAKENSKRYVNNVSEALKELMRLGIVCKATLPASASSVDAYRGTTFALTELGRTWVDLLTDDRPRGYDALCETLLRHHPQFKSFLDTIGAFGESERQSFEIPLMRWGDLGKPRSRERYVQALAVHIAQQLSTNGAGWTIDASEARSAIASYVQAIVDRARARERPDPPSAQSGLREQVRRSSSEACVHQGWGAARLHLDGDSPTLDSDARHRELLVSRPWWLRASTLAHGGVDSI